MPPRWHTRILTDPMNDPRMPNERRMKQKERQPSPDERPERPRKKHLRWTGERWRRNASRERPGRDAIRVHLTATAFALFPTRSSLKWRSLSLPTMATFLGNSDPMKEYSLRTGVMVSIFRSNGVVNPG